MGLSSAFGQALTSGADFLKIDSGARSGGMGDAFTGVADDVNALTFNPAGLALLDKPQAGYLRMVYLSDIAYNFGGVALPLSDGENTWGLGAGIVNLGMPSFDSTLGIAPAVSAGDNAVLASVAFRVKDIVSFGITGKYILRDIAGYTAQAFAGDAGVLLTPLDHLRIGLTILNVGQDVQFISAADPLPTTARLGLAYQVLDIPHHSLLFAVDNGYQIGSATYIGSAGAEYWYDKTLALRVGYTGDAYQQHMTAGVGVNVDIVEFDYAYAPMGTLGDTHRFSLTARLGPEELQGLAAPAGFMARSLDGAVALSWKAASSADVVGYNLYVKKPGGQGLALVNKRPLNDTNVKLNHLLNGQNYAFALTSVSAAGRESGMAQLSAMPQGGAAVAPSLMAPTGFKAALSGEGFTLLWDSAPAADVAGYNLYAADDQGRPVKKLSAQPIAKTSITLKNVNATRVYSFVLTAVNQAGGESPATPVLKVSLADLKNAVAAQFLPPSHLVLQAVNGNLHLSWDAASGAVKYNVYVSHDGGASFNLLTPKGLAKTEVTMGGIKTGQSYTFGVSALSAEGKESQKAVQTLSVQ
jgi:fibronectin type 3 domain-containing protein